MSFRIIFSLMLLISVRCFAAPPTAILVHGALFTSSGWAPVQSILQNDGYRVVILDVPGRAQDGLVPGAIDLNIAVDKLCKVITAVGGPVVLVGHSQGGALITQAVQTCGDSIKKLVYVAAVVPLDGETAFQELDPIYDTGFTMCVDLDERAGLFRLKRTGPLEETFFQDLRAKNPAAADVALASMVSEPSGIGNTPLHYNSKRFEAIPKVYVETLRDRVVSPQTQRRLQGRTHFDVAYSLDTGHSPFLSMPRELGRIIEAALRDETTTAHAECAFYPELCI